MEFLAALARARRSAASRDVVRHEPGRPRPAAASCCRRTASRRPPRRARSGLPVVLIINGIHAGEVEGKEASLMLMRDLLDGTHARPARRSSTLVVVPLFNPDGNDAIDPANRRLDLPKLEGQIGPTLVGTRVNGVGINLNRDYMRQAAPEMRAAADRASCRSWEPDLTIDNHATNGSVHRFAMTYDVPHTVDERPRRADRVHARRTMMPAVTAALASEPRPARRLVRQLRRGRARARRAARRRSGGAGRPRAG